ncbi:MAG: hypothetical protein ACLQJR_34245 [Stellaceae bacterium]
MGIRLAKPWTMLATEAVRALPGQLGVFELGDGEGRVLQIGYAGGRSLFGLRSEIEAARQRHRGARQFRYEVTMQYLTRYQELLMLHLADHGALPEGNRGERMKLGRLSPLKATARG